MKASKRIFALMVFCLMIFNTVSAFAADRDVWEKATETKFATRMEMRTDKAKILKVRQKPNDYYFEANGHLFDMKTMYEEFAKDKLNFVAQLVPAKAVKPVEEGLKVASVSAINAKTIKVTFSQALKDEEKAKLDVKVSKTVGLTKKWASDNMSLELTKTTIFASGKYEVTVTMDGKELIKKELEFKKVAPAKIVIADDVIAKAAPASLDVKVYDQYENEMTAVAFGGATAFVVNKTEAGRKVTPVAYNSLNTNNCEIADELEVTVVLDKDPSMKAVKVVKVGYPVDKDVEILFGEIKLPEGKTELYPSAKFHIPLTVKKDGKVLKGSADEIFLNAGTVITAFPELTGVKVFFDVDSIATLKYVKADNELEVTLKADEVGTYSLKFVDATAKVFETQYTVVKAPAPAILEVKTMPSLEVQNTKDTELEFRVVLDNGEEAKGTDLAGYNLKLTKKSAANAIFSAPAHNAVLANANIIAPITITGADNDKVDTFTYQLYDPTNQKVGDPVELTLKSVSAVNKLAVTTDKAKYTAGEEIKLVVTLQTAANVTLAYDMEFKNAKIEIGNDEDSYFRDLKFEKGVAKVTVPARVLMTPAELVKVTADGLVNAATPTIEVVAADMSKFVVKKGGAAGQLTITATDEFGNKVAEFVGDKVLTITAVNTNGDPIKLDKTNGENQISLTFAGGEIANAQVYTAPDLAAGSVVTVKFEGFTGTFTY